MACLAFGALERAARLQPHLGADADVGLDLFAQLSHHPFALRLVEYLAFATQLHVHLDTV
ncbi:hypothetical protein D3C73_1585560 [compost metagenome]